MRGVNLTLRTLIKPAIAAVFSFIGLVSCGPSQYAMNDGIYGSSTRIYDTNSQEEIASDNSGIYANYFNQGASELQDAQEAGTIFTDVDSYSSNSQYNDDEAMLQGELAYNANAGWGDTYDEVVINIYPSLYNQIGFGSLKR